MFLVLKASIGLFLELRKESYNQTRMKRLILFLENLFNIVKRINLNGLIVKSNK